MPTKRLCLTLGELRLTRELVSTPQKGDLETARMVDEIRTSLKLRLAMRELEEINEEGRDLGTFPFVMGPNGQPLPTWVGWEGLLDPEGELISRLDKQVCQRTEELETADSELAREILAEGLTGLQNFRTRIQSLAEEHQFAVSQRCLTALGEMCTSKDWNVLPERDQRTGVVTEQPTLVPTAQLIIFAHVANKISQALGAPAEEPGE